MPLYEFACDECSHRFERIQKFSDPNPAACPKCGGTVQKLLSSPAIQFKGSGFYLTDYGRSGSKGDAANVKAGKNESGSAGSGGDTKSSDTGASTKSDVSPSSSSSGGSGGGSGGSGESASAKPAAPTKAD